MGASTDCGSQHGPAGGTWRLGPWPKPPRVDGPSTERAKPTTKLFMTSGPRVAWWSSRGSWRSAASRSSTRRTEVRRGSPGRCSGGVSREGPGGSRCSRESPRTTRMCAPATLGVSTPKSDRRATFTTRGWSASGTTGTGGFVSSETKMRSARFPASGLPVFGRCWSGRASILIGRGFGGRSLGWCTGGGRIGVLGSRRDTSSDRSGDFRRSSWPAGAGGS